MSGDEKQDESMSEEERCSSSDSEMADLEEQEEQLSPEQLAEKKKADGNILYQQKNYTGALQLYSEAIELCPTCCAYYGNRAATYMMLSQYEKALADARQSTTIDPAFVKGHLREAKCHLAMGEAAAAVCSYEKVLALDPNSTTAKNDMNQAKTVQQYTESGELSYDKGDYRRVVFCMDRCIELAPGCNKFKVIKAECLALLKRYQEAQDMVNDILRMDGINADAVYVRGLCLYYQDNIDKAFQHFQQVLRLAPDHKKARDIYKRAKLLKVKKEEGNEAFRQGRFQEAMDLYSEALKIDPLNIFTNSKLYCNRATVGAKLNKLDEAISDCSKAINLDGNYIKAFLRRAKCYMEKEQYEEAVRDYEKIVKMDKSREYKKLLQEAKIELKKSKRKDYYKILGVNKSATEDEIKKAYKKRALLHHPDRHANSTDDVKKEEEKKFKECGEAYTILSDAKKKARYDSGQDLDDEGGYSEFDPNTIFQTFFSGPGGFGGFPGGGGGFPGGGGFHGHSHGGQHQGFPGGFTFQFG